MLEVDVVDLPGRRPDREDRHRDHGPRARGALAVARPRAHAARRLDPRRAEDARREKKWILREALRGWLPDDILDRPKQGFAVPLSSWLRTRPAGWAREVLLDPRTLDRGYFEPRAVARLLDRHAAGADGDAKRIWALLMLELWHREFVDAPAPALRAAA